LVAEGAWSALALFVRRLKRGERPTGWGRLAVGNALVFLCLATPLLLAGEAYFRFVYDTTDSLAYTRVSEPSPSCMRWGPTKNISLSVRNWIASGWSWGCRTLTCCRYLRVCRLAA
jgi:hypothetical protein